MNSDTTISAFVALLFPTYKRTPSLGGIWRSGSPEDVPRNLRNARGRWYGRIDGQCGF
jgi:hypothetical protein